MLRFAASSEMDSLAVAAEATIAIITTSGVIQEYCFMMITRVVLAVSEDVKQTEKMHNDCNGQNLEVVRRVSRKSGYRNLEISANFRRPPTRD